MYHDSSGKRHTHALRALHKNIPGRWNFLTAILAQVAGHKFESSQNKFLANFLPSFFHSIQNASNEWTRVFLFLRFFMWILKPQLSLVFCKNSPVVATVHGAQRLESLLN
jgi:hypothetical protein